MKIKVIQVYDFARELFDAFKEDVDFASKSNRRLTLSEPELSGYLVSRFLRKVIEGDHSVYCPAEGEEIPYDWPLFREGTYAQESPYARDIELPEQIYKTCIEEIIPKVNHQLEVKRLDEVEPVCIEALVSWAIKLVINDAYNNEEMPVSSKELPLTEEEEETLYTLKKEANA